jgi:hypothetical protein
MRRIRVIPYKQASRSARELSRAIGGKCIRLNNSRYRPRQSDLLINWGNSSYPHTEGTMLNEPYSVSLASNKLSTVMRLQDEGVKTVDWTRDPMEVYCWLNEGHTVYARTTLQGHSGSGIEVLTGGVVIPGAKLYTKAITGKRREWRIHVCNGKVILIQKKKRRSGYNDNDDYSNDIRNVHTGWIYSVNDTEECPDSVISSAIDSVLALGLDFGGVDIISQRDDHWVLEVNTAVGLSGESTLNAYVEALKEYT